MSFGKNVSCNRALCPDRFAVDFYIDNFIIFSRSNLDLCNIAYTVTLGLAGDFDVLAIYGVFEVGFAKFAVYAEMSVSI